MDGHCPNCQAQVASSDERCTQCGADLRGGTPRIGSLGVAAPARTSRAPRMALPSGQQRVCPQCGALALDQHTHCPRCEASYGDALLLVPSTFEQRFWVGIEATLTCRACGHASPCNHLDIEHSVTCLHCGLEQRLDPNQWWGALSHAHAVADLCGPHPEGRFPNELVSIRRHNPFAQVGTSCTSAEHHGTSNDRGQPILDVIATPGHPPCPVCHTPLELVRVAPPELALECPNPACGERTTTVLPDGVRMKIPDLVGIAGSEHEKGRRDVRIQRGPAGLGCYCPACSAIVSVVSYSTLVECQHCHTISRVPDKALRSLGFEAPKRQLWWLLFEGPSKLRAKLERTERRAVARAPARPGPARPSLAEPDDEAAEPLTGETSVGLKLLIGALLLLAVTGVVLAAVSQGRVFD
jgi:hypothetical protein